MKIVRAYQGGIQGLIQHVIRDDGAGFRRYQNKTPRGYRWGAWKFTGNHCLNNLPGGIAAGFSTLYHVAKTDPVYGHLYRARPQK